MATDILLVREGNKLGAAEPWGAEAIEAMHHGEMVTATLRRTRNPGHHRKFFALLNVVYKAQTRYATLEHLLNAVKIATGHYDVCSIEMRGFPVQVCIPKSISFAKMGQTAFEQFYNKAVDFILTEVIPGLDRDDLERQVLEILA